MRIVNQKLKKGVSVASAQSTAEAEAATLEMEEQFRSMEKEVNYLKNQVSELEEEEIKLSQILRDKKKDEAAKARTSFKVDMGKE